MMVSKSAYYDYFRKQGSNFGVGDVDAKVISIFRTHKKRYGTRRIVKELRAQDVHVGRDRVRQVMRHYSLKSIHSKSYVPKTTQSPAGMLRSPNLLLNRAAEKELNKVWVGDITYLPLAGRRWAYLAVWLDVYSRYVVGWEIATHMRSELVVNSLKKGLKSRRPKAGLIIHTDGGGQYGSKAFRKLLANSDIDQSMTRRDNHYDNAMAESFFSRLKAELLQGGRFVNEQEAYKECFDYIEGYYNTIRSHSSIGYQSPLQFERELEKRENKKIAGGKSIGGPKASVSLRSTPALGLG